VARMSFALDPAGGTEPLGRRIIVVPRNLEDVESNDSHATFIAYVPPGGIAEGATLVKTGGDGLTVPCETCHGPGLRGTDTVPCLAGRSPSYLVRQLYEFQQGLRAGPDSARMQPVVARLSVDEMIELAAYAASIPGEPAPNPTCAEN
jgi:cytochrome c553